MKTAYLPDLKLLEENNFIVPGSVICADNVIFPGSPDYLEYVKTSPNYDSVGHEATLEYDTSIKDEVWISTRK